ncbi:HAMP domain-containing sensor histidine kinase [Streptomyces sp. NPDC093085]|uniref:HAMP domain-containing sensor histidine kinase n=1 Tax=Streptomyces sp. NPDC093085 TaxID=3155068 RepID=UPI00343EA049
MCCALATLLGILVHVSVTRQTVDAARAKALSRLTEVTRIYESGRPLPRFAGVDPPGLPEPLRVLATHGERGTMVAAFRGRPTMWAAGPADGHALAAHVDYSLSQSTITHLDRAILGSSVLAIGATLLVGAFAMTRVTRRLHLTAQVARRISAGDLDARVDDPRTRPPTATSASASGSGSRRVPYPRDEVATVSAALDAMAATLQRKLLSEQRFTADVAHELRTPLTGLSAAAELLPEGRPTELVRDRVRAMRKLTEDLLEISRLDARTEKVDLAVHALGPLVEGVVRAASAPAPGTTSGTTEVRILRDAAVETDRRRLERVLGNLVANAHRHGRAPVILTVEGPVVTVRDHGAGYPAYLLEHGPQRFRTEGTAVGHGLGLTIAAGQAEVIGAELAFRNAPEGGALAQVTLTAYVPAEPPEQYEPPEQQERPGQHEPPVPSDRSRNPASP